LGEVFVRLRAKTVPDDDNVEPADRPRNRPDQDAAAATAVDALTTM